MTFTLPEPAFGGLRIMASSHWPQVEDGTYRVRFPAHPFIFWLARWLSITPWVEAEYLKFQDADPLMDEACGIVYCSRAQEAYLRRELVTS